MTIATRTTHTIPRSTCMSGEAPRVSVTLPAIPGVALTNDRPETAPTARIIRRKRRGVYGAARIAAYAPIINARVRAIREALEADHD